MTFEVRDTGGIGIWFQADALRGFDAVDKATVAIFDALPPELNAISYRAGYAAAVTALAAIFGLTYTPRPIGSMNRKRLTP